MTQQKNPPTQKAKGTLAASKSTPIPGSGASRKKTKASTAAVPPTGSTPALAAPEPRKRRGNKRSELTVDNIFAATEQVVLQSGTDRVSILDVCAIAGISRGTFYRYFASQDELLDAFSRHNRENFHRSLAEVLAPHSDPDERFAAMVKHIDAYLSLGNSRHLLQVAPEFALKHFKRIFSDSVIRFQDLLASVFDAWDARLGVKLDRELICELMVRFMLSENLVGDDSERHNMPRRIGRLVDALRFGSVIRARR